MRAELERGRPQPRPGGSSSPAFSMGRYLEKMRMVLRHYSYYLTLLRQLPYGAVRRITRKRCRGYSTMEPYLRYKYGLEIGGPSPIFCENKLIPVYDRCREIDSCNFSGQTIWSNAVDRAGFGSSRGKQYVADASDLSVIPDGTYDFVLASHVFEHLANPLRTLEECKRVLVPEGALLIIVPDRRATFDRKRPFTSFDHLKADFQANTSQDDFTHLDEILASHDLELDPWAGSWQNFRERCLRNPSIRAMHHHVFSPEVLTLMFSRLGMRVLNISIERPFHMIAFAVKADAADQEEIRLHNLSFLGESADWRKHDPLCRLSTAPLAATGYFQSRSPSFRAVQGLFG